MQKQTPRIFMSPMTANELWRSLDDLVRKVRNDLDNGATTFPVEDIAGVDNTDITTFDPGQIRFKRDTSDSNKLFLVTRDKDDTLHKLEMTSI